VTYATPWAVVRRPLPDARLRLFCFPHAGGAASAFAAWGAALPDDIELVAVQPPGRERRMAEPPFDRMEPFLDAAYGALRPLWDRPFAFFGHSTGALVAYELARRLRREAAPGPQQLIASGRWAPHLHDPEPPVYALPEEELIAALRRYGGTPEEVLAHRELLELMLPLLRADFALGDTYQYRAEPPLALPITAVGGADDPRVPLGSLQAWGTHTTGPFAAHLLPGDHFYLQTQREALTDLVIRALHPAVLAR
jgi:medium-chain acyl-[acyl-carrier-protein] hydrolase